MNFENYDMENIASYNANQYSCYNYMYVNNSPPLSDGGNTTTDWNCNISTGSYDSVEDRSSSPESIATNGSTGATFDGIVQPQEKSLRVTPQIMRKRRLAANARERRRMQNLNNAFDRLMMSFTLAQGVLCLLQPCPLDVDASSWNVNSRQLRQWLIIMV